MENEFKDKPFQMIAIKPDGQFEITVDGINFLSSLKKKQVAFLSIAGPYRSGKSFLANQLLNKYLFN